MSELAGAALILIGGAFMLLAGIGIVRLPDVYIRMQAATKAATLGAGCMLLAVAFHFGDGPVAARAVLAATFVFLTVPVAAHAIARSAYVVGVPFWEGTVADEYGGRRAPPGKKLSNDR